MTNGAEPENYSSQGWSKPTLGAICFGVLMYVGTIFGARHRLVMGALFVVIGIAGVVAGRKFTKPYSPAAFGFYIFAASCVIFGAASLAA